MTENSFLEGFTPRLPWSQCDCPRVMAALHYTERPDELDEFHHQRIIAKGDSTEIISAEEKMRIALDLVTTHLTDDYVRQVYDSLCDSLTAVPRPVTIHVPLSVRDTNLDKTQTEQLSSNMMAIVFTLELARRLNEISMREQAGLIFSNEKRLIRLTKNQPFNVLGRANADAIGRLVQLSRYDAPQITAEDYVLLADDHIQNGAVTKAMLDAVIRRGGKILGIATLGAMPESLHLEPPFSAQKALRDCLQFSLNSDTEYVTLENTLNVLGLSVESLATREVLTLAAMFLDGHHPEQKATFDHLAAEAGASPLCQEAQKDSLQKLLREPAVLPSTLAQKIGERLTQLTRNHESSTHAK